MSHKNFPISGSNEQEQLLLKAKIKALQKELDDVEQKTNAFEAILRSHLINQLIEEQELTVLYKKLQQQKKEKRLAQKMRGKKFKDTKSLQIVTKIISSKTNDETLKEKKKLYREAMLHVHPDKFSMNHEKIDVATEITAKLIEIYQTGNLVDMQTFHAHIFSGNALKQFDAFVTNREEYLVKDVYLKKELEALIIKLEKAKTSHTYKVLTEYENPLTFIEELKEYYADRIFKLKKRTRKANL